VGLRRLREQLEAGERDPSLPRDVLRVGVERLLEEAQRGGGERDHLVRPRPDLVAQPRGRDDGVDEAPALGRRRVVAAAQEPDLAGSLLADDSRQVGGAETGVEGPDTRADLAEARVVGGDRQVTEHVEHVAAADRVAVDGRDDRLRNVADPGAAPGSRTDRSEFRRSSRSIVTQARPRSSS